MDHLRIRNAVVTVTAGYVVVLALWIAFVVRRSPEGTLPYQIAGLVAAFGATLGLAMMWASRPSREDRRLDRHGLEGWARVLGVEGETVELELTVPGWPVYEGTVVHHGVALEVGSTVPIKVDPDNRDRIRL